MHHQSDYGYSTGAVSNRCIACGSYELNCCDGTMPHKPRPAMTRTELLNAYLIAETAEEADAIAAQVRRIDVLTIADDIATVALVAVSAVALPVALWIVTP